MKKYNIKADKRLGQHFLKDEEPLFSMLKAAQLTPEDNVLEIGPGLGVLTLELCRIVKKVVAVEKDRRFVPILNDLTQDFKNVCILEEDVLKLDWKKIRESIFEGDFKVVANLPYYITAPIIMKIVENRQFIPLAVIMVQKEVAHRLAASCGSKDYGILSIAVNVYADVDIICEIGRGSFVPPPKVDSAIVRITLNKKPRISTDEEFFFKVVEAAFGERRKTIRNSLKSRLNLLELDQSHIDKALDTAGINPMRRGETLSIEEFDKLAGALKRALNMSKNN
ncbi:16S rRNA (adenine(1518)-N(6)/adenine(1519)-N(6))-dimethyltransferase RsmA [Tepidanaerobacter sp. EBM-49]|uniref:16S rRNA (adenine(1518)-N(6)/adenine(1519)-N(6))- dimethyltransferase RsmA n=1 Tax=Tepidanaerobacter sp. EBM-49 TaxID=1918504 RepID=UPI000ADAEAD8|nr:16S rRNA (adenine(1518)-N(6)/adenine(1519)-N(6))-dimethyltransferase RsmA [Tepidanaerobacter sp. EBM-49]